MSIICYHLFVVVYVYIYIIYTYVVSGQWDHKIPFLNTVFSGSSQCRLWVPMLEKAYAKEHGSYNALSGGLTDWALSDLTGAPCLDFRLASEDPEKLWRKLLRAHAQDFLLTACIYASMKEDYYSQIGLPANHAYTILKVVEIPLSTGDSGSEAEGADKVLKMVKVRNPHGKKGDVWHGRWGQGSSVWDDFKHIDVRAALGLNPKGKEESGVFVMEYTDFLDIYSTVTVCKLRPGWLEYRKAEEFTPHVANVLLAPKHILHSGLHEIKLPSPSELAAADERGIKASNFIVAITRPKNIKLALSITILEPVYGPAEEKGLTPGELTEADITGYNVLKTFTGHNIHNRSIHLQISSDPTGSTAQGEDRTEAAKPSSEGESVSTASSAPAPPPLLKKQNSFVSVQTHSRSVYVLCSVSNVSGKAEFVPKKAFSAGFAVYSPIPLQVRRRRLPKEQAKAGDDRSSLLLETVEQTVLPAAQLALDTTVVRQAIIFSLIPFVRLHTYIYIYILFVC